MTQEKTYMEVENLDVYQRLCKLHIEVCDLSHEWPQEERYQLGSQVRRSSNSSPAQLAEKHDDRHIRNKIEGVNRSRGEAGQTIYPLFMAKLKGYVDPVRLRFLSQPIQGVHPHAQRLAEVAGEASARIGPAVAEFLNSGPLNSCITRIVSTFTNAASHGNEFQICLARIQPDADSGAER